MSGRPFRSTSRGWNINWIRRRCRLRDSPAGRRTSSRQARASDSARTSRPVPSREASDRNASGRWRRYFPSRSPPAPAVSVAARSGFCATSAPPPKLALHGRARALARPRFGHDFARDIAAALHWCAPGPFDRNRLQIASIDHAMRFHRPFRAGMSGGSLWQDSPSASGARGFSRGLIYSADGKLVASVAQGTIDSVCATSLLRNPQCRTSARVYVTCVDCRGRQ